MSVLCGFPSPRLPDYDNNLMFGVLSDELATFWPWLHVLFRLTNKRQRRTHQFIEFIHLIIYWQLFSSFEYFVVLIRMWQATERVFVPILLGHQECDVKGVKSAHTMAPRACFAVTLRGMKPNNGCFVELAIVFGLEAWSTPSMAWRWEYDAYDESRQGSLYYRDTAVTTGTC